MESKSEERIIQIKARLAESEKQFGENNLLNEDFRYLVEKLAASETARAGMKKRALDAEYATGEITRVAMAVRDHLRMMKIDPGSPERKYADWLEKIISTPLCDGLDFYTSSRVKEAVKERTEQIIKDALNFQIDGEPEENDNRRIQSFAKRLEDKYGIR